MAAIDQLGFVPRAEARARALKSNRRIGVLTPFITAPSFVEGAARLARVADDPRHEAEILLAAALGVPRAYLAAHPERQVQDCEATDRFEACITRRAQGESVAYILGVKEFWSLPLAVDAAVLIPRAETELVVERALAHLPPGAAADVLDLAAGSGAIALAIASERPGCRVTGTDVSRDAVAVASRNARRLGLERVAFLAGPWYEPVQGRRFDLIASNPPYIAEGDPRVERSVQRFEPHAALYAGPTGLEALQEIACGATPHLKPGAATDALALSGHCGARLAGYKRPREFRFVGALPRTTEGKLQRRRLTETAGNT